MNIKTIEKNNIRIALVQSEEVQISDVQSALDFVLTIGYDTGCDHIALNKAAISEDFFKLSTCLAGDVLQKFINYHIKFAVIGDFSHYTSKPLKDLIYESNRGRDVFFVFSEDEALEKLSRV
jgi:hypothetical protein